MPLLSHWKSLKILKLEKHPPSHKATARQAKGGGEAAGEEDCY